MYLDSSVLTGYNGRGLYFSAKAMTDTRSGRWVDSAGLGKDKTEQCSPGVCLWEDGICEAELGRPGT
jgi:hypothetical protein